MINALRPLHLTPFPEPGEEDELERQGDGAAAGGPGRPGAPMPTRDGDIESDEGERF